MEEESVAEAGSLSSGIVSRRNLLKAGAIVGGVAWAAPVIDSFASPASATSYTQYSHGCVVCYYEIVGDGGSSLVAFYAGQDDPTEYNTHAAGTCAANAPTGVTSGKFIVFDSNTTNLSSNDALYECLYSNAALTPTVIATTLTCPGSLPGDVFCFTGTW